MTSYMHEFSQRERDPREILSEVKLLAAEYYAATEKPLGVTGEVAEYEAADKLRLELAPARTPGYDAIRNVGGSVERIQVKGRRITEDKRIGSQRLSKTKLDDSFDYLLLVLLDEKFNAFEIWEAPYEAVHKCLCEPGSKARNERHSLSISKFKTIAEKVWSAS